MSTLRKTAASVTVVAGLASLTIFVLRLLAGKRLDRLDQQLAEAQRATQERTDLPAQVVALAQRLGASAEHPASYVDIRQGGKMWLKPGGPPQGFTARQRIGTSGSGFVWRAQIGPLGKLWVVDSFVQGRGLLEARLFGALRVAKMDGTAEINQGETLRYLAELPMNPDAILFDHDLDWTVDGERSIRVASGIGDARAEVTIGLNDEGLIVTVGAPSRTFGSTGKRYPWRGRFWDYQGLSGRLVPVQAEVAWVIDGEEFIYWRGKIESWQPVGAQFHA